MRDMGGSVVEAAVDMYGGQDSSVVTGIKVCMGPYGDMEFSLGGEYAEYGE